MGIDQRVTSEQTLCIATIQAAPIFSQMFQIPIFNLEKVPKQTKLIAFGCWFLSLLISLSVLIGGVADQLTFGSNVCLLYIENYHEEPQVGWIFDTYSPMCHSIVSVGSIGLFLLFTIGLLRGYFLYKSEEPSRNVILALMWTAVVWTVVSLVFAIILTTGIDKTCQQFEKRNRSCGSIFGDGFFVNDKKDVYRKNIDTVYAASGAGWAVTLFWALYAYYEYVALKSSTLRWW